MNRTAFLSAYFRMLIYLFLAFVAARLFIMHFVDPGAAGNGFLSILHAFFTGMQADMKLAVLCSIPLGLCLLIAPLENTFDRLWHGVLVIYAYIFALVVSAYAVSFQAAIVLGKGLKDGAVFDVLANLSSQSSLFAAAWSQPIWALLVQFIVFFSFLWCFALLMWNHIPSKPQTLGQKAHRSLIPILLVVFLGHLPFFASHTSFTESYGNSAQMRLAFLALNPALLVGDQVAKPAPKPEAPKAEAPKSEAPKAETPAPVKPTEGQKAPEAAKPEASKPEAAKPETSKTEAPKK